MSDLDPRGLEEAARVIAHQNSEILGHDTWDELEDEQRDCLHSEAADIITAYLEVAQPVVESVEGLAALPGRSAVVDADGMVAQMDAHDPHHWDGLERCWDATQIALPARVIWRPGQ